MSTVFLESVFKLLSTNLQYPYYQGERRIDVFINFFIEDIIRQHTVFKDAEYLVPEFPLKKNDLTDHAAHIDYLMFSKAHATVLLIELKTDDSSYLDDQIMFYLKHPHFSALYQKYSTIKMKGFRDKKDALNKRMEVITNEDFSNYKIAVIVLKPSINNKDQLKKDEFKDRLHFIQLASLDIKTDHQNEWELFKNNILKKLRTKVK